MKHVGGVVGALDNGTLSQAENRGSVTTSGSYDCIAGVAGYMWASTIEYSINLGTVSAGGSDAYVGGITGYSNTSNTIRSCYNYGAVSSGGETSCGAIIGWCRDPRTVLENCCYLENSAGRAAGKNGDTNKEPASEDRVYAKDEAAFRSGEVTWLLNGGSVAEDGTVTDPSGNAWGQTIPGGSLPVLGGAAVYRYETCDGVEGFTNDSSQAGKQEHQLDENYRCTVCGQQMAASVTADEKTVYYTDIAEAFKDACTAGSTAVVTLLADAQAGETLIIPEGSSVTLISGTDSEGDPYTISGNVNAADSGLIDIRGGSLTLESGNVENGGNGTNGTNAIAVNDGSFVMTGGTVRAASNWNSAICVYSGTADIRGGTASGDSSAGAYGAAAVGSSSTVLVSSGAVSGSGNGAGIYVHSGGRAEVSGGSVTGGAYGLQIGSGSGVLSGGTFTGTEAAVSAGDASAVKSLLDAGKAYYTGTDTTAENLITDLGGKTLSAGTVTVGACTHSYDTWTDKNDGEHHRRSCVVCGLETEEDHTWDENGKCLAEGCEAEGSLVAAVTADGETAYYTDLDKAWTAARSAGNAEVLLLKSVERSSSLPVQSGEDITLAMAEGVVLSSSANYVVNISAGGSVTMKSGSVVGHGVYGIWVNGSFTLEDGSIACEGGSGIYVSGTWANAVLNGGRVSGKYGLSVYGLSDAAGATVQGADISASQYGVSVMGGSVRIESGSVSGENRGMYVDEGTAYLNGGTVSSPGTGAYTDSIGKIEINGSTVSGETGVYGGGWGVLVLSGTITGEETGMLINGYSSRISGGTICGGTYSVYCQVDTILSETLADYHFYYAVAEDGSQTLISDAAVLGGRELSAEDGYGTVTVKECIHSYGEWTENEDGNTHSQECEICGHMETEEHSSSGVWIDKEDGTCSEICDDCGAELGNAVHSYGSWTDNRDGSTHTGKCENCGHEEKESHTWDANGICTVCGAKLYTVSVTIQGADSRTFTSIDAAWEYAKEYSTENTAATVTLLSDVTAVQPLTVADGDNIILESEGSGGGWYGISGGFGYAGILVVDGGSFTMNSGGLCNTSQRGGYAYAYDLQVSSGSVVINNGEFTDSGYAWTYGIYITGGTLKINDCEIRTAWQAVSAYGGEIEINGGRISGGNIGIEAIQMDSGKLCINGGNISGDSHGIIIFESAVEITGGMIIGGNTGVIVDSDSASTVLGISGGRISGSAYGLSIDREINKDSSITGGVFTGGVASVYVRYYSLCNLYSLVRTVWRVSVSNNGAPLIEGQDSGYYYYKVNADGSETQIDDYTLRSYSYSGGYLYASDGYGTVAVRKEGAAKTVSVEVTWGALEYTYTDGAWDPDTHTYEEGQWTAARGADCIMVRNTGSVDVTVSYRYRSSDTDLSGSLAAGDGTFDTDAAKSSADEDGMSDMNIQGSFTDEDGNSIDSPVALLEWEEKKAYLTLTGRPKPDFTEGTLGIVTVVIGNK